VKYSLSYGVLGYDPVEACFIDELLARADDLMYKEKRRKQKT
jgi:PleD family two-component response regulator